jgi:hypothetical protein
MSPVKEVRHIVTAMSNSESTPHASPPWILRPLSTADRTPVFHIPGDLDCKRPLHALPLVSRANWPYECTVRFPSFTEVDEVCTNKTWASLQSSRYITPKRRMRRRYLSLFPRVQNLPCRHDHGGNQTYVHGAERSTRRSSLRRTLTIQGCPSAIGRGRSAGSNKLRNRTRGTVF